MQYRQLNHLYHSKISLLSLLGDVKVLSSEKSPLVMKDVKWYTHNCTVGYMVSGQLQIYLFINTSIYYVQIWSL